MRERGERVDEERVEGERMRRETEWMVRERRE